MAICIISFFKINIIKERSTVVTFYKMCIKMRAAIKAVISVYCAVRMSNWEESQRCRDSSASRCFGVHTFLLLIFSWKKWLCLELCFSLDFEFSIALRIMIMGEISEPWQWSSQLVLTSLCTKLSALRRVTHWRLIFLLFFGRSVKGISECARWLWWR